MSTNQTDLRSPLTREAISYQQPVLSSWKPAFVGILISAAFLLALPFLQIIGTTSRKEKASEPTYPQVRTLPKTSPKSAPPHPTENISNPQPQDQPPPPQAPAFNIPAPSMEIVQSPPELNLDLPAVTFDLPPLTLTLAEAPAPPVPALQPVPEATASYPEPAPVVHTAASDVVYDNGDVDEIPRYKRTPEPIYPARARRRGLEGEVILELIVDEEGKPRSPHVVQAKPEGLFEKAALDALAHWTFYPGRKEGKEVRTRTRVRIAFRLTQ